jgi:hypothetical protein
VAQEERQAAEVVLVEEAVAQFLAVMAGRELEEKYEYIHGRR